MIYCDLFGDCHCCADPVWMLRIRAAGTAGGGSTGRSAGWVDLRGGRTARPWLQSDACTHNLECRPTTRVWSDRFLGSD